VLVRGWVTRFSLFLYPKSMYKFRAGSSLVSRRGLRNEGLELSGVASHDMKSLPPQVSSQYRLDYETASLPVLPSALFAALSHLPGTCIAESSCCCVWSSQTTDNTGPQVLPTRCKSQTRGSLMQVPVQGFRAPLSDFEPGAWDYQSCMSRGV
jgi:hypothetical protein